jgi:hypothetical protein
VPICTLYVADRRCIVSAGTWAHSSPVSCDRSDRLQQGRQHGAWEPKIKQYCSKMWTARHRWCTAMWWSVSSTRPWAVSSRSFF